MLANVWLYWKCLCTLSIALPRAASTCHTLPRFATPSSSRAFIRAVVVRIV